MDEETISVTVFCHSDYGDNMPFNRQIDIVKAADLTFDPGSRSWTGALPAAMALDIPRWRLLVEAAEAGAGVILASSAAPVDDAQASSRAIGDDSGPP